jgi:hypothetical protein
MSQTKSFVLLAGAALSLGGFNTALAQQGSPDEVRAVVAEMLNDAETRSSLLADGGHDANGFMISGEGFTLRVGGQIQFRYLLNFNDDQGNDDGFESGFQSRRTKLWFAGNIINEKWHYKIMANFDHAGDGGLQLEDAYTTYDFGSGFYTKLGQFKLAFLREENISDAKQLAVERSIANGLFNQGWSQGFEAGYKADAWRFAAAFSDGLATANTDFTSPVESDWSATGRAEFVLAGATANWDMWDDFTAEQGGKFGLLLGAAVTYQDSANTNNPADVDAQYLGYTADISVKGDGWNAFGAFLGRHLDTRGPVGISNNPTFDDFGIVAQAGIRLAKGTELFGRWDAVFLDEDRNLTGDNDCNFLTVGVNQYFAGHAAKATADVVYSFDQTGNLASAGVIGNSGTLSTGTGLLGDTDEGELVIRLQFQLLF